MASGGGGDGGGDADGELFIPSECYGHNSGTVLSYLQESGLCHVKMLQGRIAPATVVVRQSRVWRAEIGGSDGDGGGEAPSGVVVASHLVAGAATQAIVEQGRAKCCSVGSIPLTVQVPVSTCSSCKTPKTPSQFSPFHLWSNFFFVLLNANITSRITSTTPNNFFKQAIGLSIAT
ncbi:hypothetical protein RJ639_026080 [Escallonia herrerae]|uniref:Uncharacterized protein n=1 Tax=Escallonia herrerae TaxID=1293975 RepID=A0AA88UYM0_9ASTE|nr:hypothetical protein RJ639_026080 [Escallonia herrerae]